MKDNQTNIKPGNGAFKVTPDINRPRYKSIHLAVCHLKLKLCSSEWTQERNHQTGFNVVNDFTDLC